ncbi:ubiquitin carboxyl-terminal hydrolase [Phycomyces nitens]|nr:ubiquitin carboxyl-terminal hydrolase [Phycomyces nitens]
MPTTANQNATILPWCLIESDPDIFTSMISKYGVKDTRVQEVFGLDSEIFAAKKPNEKQNVHGFIFAWPYKEEPLPNDHCMPDSDSEGIFYPCQVITNACATLALLGVLLNCDSETDLGEELTQFKNFVKGFDPVNMGLAIGSNDLLRTTHNSFASEEEKQEAEALASGIEEDIKEGEEYIDEEVFHFVGYIYKNGHLWELDGLKRAPVKLGKCTLQNWTEAVKPILQERMKNTDESGFAFNLMAVVSDPLVAQKQIIDEGKNMVDAYSREIALQESMIFKSQSVLGKRKDESLHYDIRIKKDIIGWLKNDRYKYENQVITLEKEVSNELKQRDKTEADNLRLDHDYRPFLEALFKKMDERNLLVPMLQRG